MDWPTGSLRFLHYMSKTELVRALQPEADALRLISEDRARQYQSIPIRVESSRVIVAMSNPSDLATVNEIEFITGLRVEPVVSTAVEIERAITRHYQERHLLAPALSQTPEVQATPPVVRIQRLLFREAIRSVASDIHIDPGVGSCRVRYRIDGSIRDRFDIPRWLHARLIARIKILGKLDISERRIPQDGLLIDPECGVEARLSTMPTQRGEAAVIRIFRDQKNFRRWRVSEAETRSKHA